MAELRKEAQRQVERARELHIYEIGQTSNPLSTQVSTVESILSGTSDNSDSRYTELDEAVKTMKATMSRAPTNGVGQPPS